MQTECACACRKGSSVMVTLFKEMFPPLWTHLQAQKSSQVKAKIPEAFRSKCRVPARQALSSDCQSVSSAGSGGKHHSAVVTSTGESYTFGSNEKVSFRQPLICKRFLCLRSCCSHPACFSAGSMWYRHIEKHAKERRYGSYTSP